MKKHLLILLIILLFTASLLAQYSPCYETAFAEGQKEFNVSNYAKAKTYFNAAKDCPDPNIALVNEWIGKYDKAITDKNIKPTKDLTISVIALMQ